MESSRRNHVEIPLHLIWSTYERRPLLTPEVEAVAYRAIRAEAARLSCSVLALNGASDHVHLVLALSTTTSVANLMKQVKGVSSSTVRHQFGPTQFFRWEDGYAVFALSRSHCQAAIAYVAQQKERHGFSWRGWEGEMLSTPPYLGEPSPPS